MATNAAEVVPRLLLFRGSVVNKVITVPATMPSIITCLATPPHAAAVCDCSCGPGDVRASAAAAAAQQPRPQVEAEVDRLCLQLPSICNTATSLRAVGQGEGASARGAPAALLPSAAWRTESSRPPPAAAPGQSQGGSLPHVCVLCDEAHRGDRSWAEGPGGHCAGIRCRRFSSGPRVPLAPLLRAREGPQADARGM